MISYKKFFSFVLLVLLLSVGLSLVRDISFVEEVSHELTEDTPSLSHFDEVQQYFHTQMFASFSRSLKNYHAFFFSLATINRLETFVCADVFVCHPSLGRNVLITKTIASLLDISADLSTFFSATRDVRFFVQVGDTYVVDGMDVYDVHLHTSTVAAWMEMFLDHALSISSHIDDLFLLWKKDTSTLDASAFREYLLGFRQYLSSRPQFFDTLFTRAYFVVQADNNIALVIKKIGTYGEESGLYDSHADADSFLLTFMLSDFLLFRFEKKGDGLAWLVYDFFGRFLTQGSFSF